jgi:hypothetical protein
MSERSDRVTALEKAVNDYVKKEKTRVENEVSVLTDILKGRNAGAAVQSSPSEAMNAVAFNDLTAYLSG